MASDPRNRITDVYHAVLRRPREERAAFLNDTCRGDDALRQEVESLLAYESAAAPFLETPAADVVAGGLAGAGRTQMIARQLGPYTIVAPLGAGGMGEVYRARDSKLGRDVAIKILPSHFTADPERRARFAREARLLATLNHPHIGAIYGLEEADGVTRAGPRARRGPHARRPPGARAAADRRGACDRAPDRRGARRRAREGDRSSRSEARQHRPSKLGERFGCPVRRHAREGARLRPGKDDGCRSGG